MNEIREHLKRKLGITDEQYDQLVKQEREKSEIVKAVKSLKTPLDKYNEIVANPDTTLDQLKLAKIGVLKMSCAGDIYSGFTSTLTDENGTNLEIGFDTNDQANFTQQKVEFLADSTLTDVSWGTKNVGEVVLTRDEFMQLTDETANHKWSKINRYRDLRDQVNTAIDKDTVKNINW